MNAIDHTEFLSMSFPERLVQLRKARQLTQQQLADMASVHLTQVQRYEAGQTLPTLEVMKKLSVGLSVSADLLLFDEEERGPDDRLLMQFEAVKQFDEEDRQLALGLLEGLILKHQAKRLLMRSGTRLDTGHAGHDIPRATTAARKQKRPARAER